MYVYIFIYNAAEKSEKIMFTLKQNVKQCILVHTRKTVRIIIAQWLVSQQIILVV